MKMKMIIPKTIKASEVGELITALSHFRYDTSNYVNNHEYKEVIEPYYDGQNYCVEGEYVTLEMVDVIEDIKKFLPLEIYCEAGEEEREDERGEIYDKAIYSLYLEKEHDRREKIA